MHKDGDGEEKKSEGSQQHPSEDRQASIDYAVEEIAGQLLNINNDIPGIARNCLAIGVSKLPNGFSEADIGAIGCKLKLRRTAGTQPYQGRVREFILSVKKQADSRPKRTTQLDDDDPLAESFASTRSTSSFARRKSRVPRPDASGPATSPAPIDATSPRRSMGPGPLALADPATRVRAEASPRDGHTARALSVPVASGDGVFPTPIVVPSDPSGQEVSESDATASPGRRRARVLPEPATSDGSTIHPSVALDDPDTQDASIRDPAASRVRRVRVSEPPVTSCRGIPSTLAIITDDGLPSEHDDTTPRVDGTHGLLDLFRSIRPNGAYASPNHGTSLRIPSPPPHDVLSNSSAVPFRHAAGTARSAINAARTAAISPCSDSAELSPFLANLTSPATSPRSIDPSLDPHLVQALIDAASAAAGNADASIISLNAARAVKAAAIKAGAIKPEPATAICAAIVAAYAAAANAYIAFRNIRDVIQPTSSAAVAVVTYAINAANKAFNIAIEAHAASLIEIERCDANMSIREAVLKSVDLKLQNHNHDVRICDIAVKLNSIGITAQDLPKPDPEDHSLHSRRIGYLGTRLSKLELCKLVASARYACDSSPQPASQSGSPEPAQAAGAAPGSTQQHHDTQLASQSDGRAAAGAAHDSTPSHNITDHSSAARPTANSKSSADKLAGDSGNGDENNLKALLEWYESNYYKLPQELVELLMTMTRGAVSPTTYGGNQSVLDYPKQEAFDANDRLRAVVDTSDVLVPYPKPDSHENSSERIQKLIQSEPEFMGGLSSMGHVLADLSGC